MEVAMVEVYMYTTHTNRHSDIHKNIAYRSTQK